MPSEDHDKIVEMYTDMKYIRSKIKDICRITQSQEIDIDSLKSFKDKSTGALAILSVIIAAIIGAGVTKLFNLW